MKAALFVVLAACATDVGFVAAPDGGVADGPGAPDADVADAPPPPIPAYTSDRTYSPLTRAVVDRLRQVATQNDDVLQSNVFMKAGDSITVDSHFMTCFDNATGVNLGASADLAGDIAFFADGDADGASPFDRKSVAATVGWSADSVLQPSGSTTFLDEEMAADFPRYALVMFGTNDADSRSLFTYQASMLTIVDKLLAQGVIPIMSSVPTQDGTSAAAMAANAKIPAFNAVARAIAQARVLPFMDFWKELQPLPSHGLGPDKLHPSAAPTGACDLSASGLQYGYNVRNLLSMRSLSRVRAVVEGGAPPDPEPTAPLVEGDGSYDHPFAIDAMPFSDLRDTSKSQNHRFNVYTGCSAAQDESGGEYIYRLVVTEPTTIHAYVFVKSQVDVDVDLHLLSGLDVADCLQRNDREITASLAAGTYYFALDTFVQTDGTPLSGEYLFLLLTEGPS